MSQPPKTTQATEYTLRADEDGLVGAKRFGELVAHKQGRDKPYNAETVRNWVKGGRVKPAGSNRRGKLYRASDAQLVAEMIRTPKQGGARKNAGRKRTKNISPTPLVDEMGRLQEAKDIVDRVSRRIDEDDEESLDPLDAAHVTELLDLTRSEMTTLVNVLGVAANHPLSPAKREALDSLVESKRKAHKLAVEMGELVSVASVERRVQETHAPVVEMLEQLPSTIIRDIEPYNWIGSQAVGEILRAVRTRLIDAGHDARSSIIHEILDDLTAMLTRPASHDEVIRSRIELIVDEARGKLAEEHGSKPGK